MNLSTLPLCGRARDFLPPLRAGRTTEAGLLRHVGACPRCRAGLAALHGARSASGSTDYIFAVVRAAARARLAALLGELARACAAGRAPARRAAGAPREVADVIEDVARLERRLRLLGAGEPPPRPSRRPAAAQALAAARECLLAAQALDGPSETQQLALAACALRAGDEITAGALCSDLVAAAGQRVERARLARRAAHVARAWGLPRGRLLPLLRQPAGAGVN